MLSKFINLFVITIGEVSEDMLNVVRNLKNLESKILEIIPTEQSGEYFK